MFLYHISLISLFFRSTDYYYYYYCAVPFYSLVFLSAIIALLFGFCLNTLFCINIFYCKSHWAQYCQNRVILYFHLHSLPVRREVYYILFASQASTHWCVIILFITRFVACNCRHADSHRRLVLHTVYLSTTQVSFGWLFCCHHQHRVGRLQLITALLTIA